MIQLFGIGIVEIGVLVLAVLLLFGGTHVKGVAKEIIHGYGKVKNMKSSVEEEFQEVLKSTILDQEDKNKSSQK